MRWRAASAGVLVAASVLLGAAPARADIPVPSGFETIPKEQVSLTVRPNGVLQVVEDITYDFGTVPHHGIIRDIQTHQHYDKRFDRVKPVTIVDVTADGQPAKYKVSSTANFVHVKIGDPKHTITGRHDYVITYTVRGAITRYANRDELLWNTIGAQWSVTRYNVAVAVRTPARITKVACYTGPVGSSAPCDGLAARGTVARFAQGVAQPGEDLTVDIVLPRGTIVPPPLPILEERWSFDRAFSRTPATLGMSFGLLGVFVVLAGLVVWRVGRDRRYVGSAVDVAFGSTDGTDQRVGLFERADSPVEFVPPDNLRPGLIGTLIDEQANPLDVTATIVDLAVRGYLVIEEIPKEGWFGKADWKLTQQKDDDGLQEYERTLFNALFRGRSTVNLSALKRTFATDLHKVEEKLYKEVVARGWFLRRPDTVRGIWFAIGILVVVLGIAATIVLAKFTHAGLVGIPIFLAGILLVAESHNMPRRTAKGTGTLRRVFGFRAFIDQSEAERARFAEQQNLFSEYLPYAIVFGCVHKWAKAFEGLAAEPPSTSWYQSSQPFSTLAFADAIDGFTVTTAGTISAAAPSSSGGGGGFSGGGGGGGGGSSW